MITLIYGAGASIPFFSPRLSTKYLTDKVLDINEWHRVFNKYSGLIDSNRVVAKVEDVCMLVKQITNVRSDANFEEIAEILDKVCSWGFDPLPRNNYLNSVVAVLGNRPVSNVIGCGWEIVPFMFRQIIAEAICDLHNNHRKTNYCELITLQKVFFEDVCNGHEKASIMSLNYDECVIESAVPAGFDTCFTENAIPDASSLDVKRFMTSNRVVYFPHGHTRFVYADNSDVLYFKDANTADEERWKRIESHMMGKQLPVLRGKFAYNFNTFLTTGQTKDDAMNNAPYCYYYHRFSHDVFDSDIVILIGYSFGDEHFNRALQAFLQIEESRRVVIVDFYEDSVTLKSEYQDESNIITKIYNNFRRDWIFNQSSVFKISPANQHEIDKINHDGYGFIFERVLFYKKGYEEFLKEYSKVLNFLK